MRAIMEDPQPPALFLIAIELACSSLAPSTRSVRAATALDRHGNTGTAHQQRHDREQHGSRGTSQRQLSDILDVLDASDAVACTPGVTKPSVSFSAVTVPSLASTFTLKVAMKFWA